VARSTAMIAVSRRCAKLRPAQACSSRVSSWPVKTGTSLPVTRGGRSPSHRVGQFVFGGQPLEELLQGAVLVAGVRAAVPVQQPRHPLLDVLPAHLLPAGPAGQAGGGEPLHRLGVDADCLGGLALGGQAQGERADLSLEYPGVQLLGLLRGTRSRCGHGHGSLPAAGHPQPSVSAAERLQSTTMTEK